MRQCSLELLKSRWEKISFGIVLALAIYIFIITFSGASQEEKWTTITLDLPNTNVFNVSIIGTIPAGLIYDNDTLIISGRSYSSLQVTLPQMNDGSEASTVSWVFDEVYSTENGNMELKFKLIAANVIGNQDGVVLEPFSATFNYWDFNNEKVYVDSGDSEAANIIEPDLQINKTASEETLLRGESVTYTIYVNHTSESDSNAYDVHVEDIVPSGMTYTPETLKKIAGPSDPEFVINPPNLVINFDVIDCDVWKGATPVVIEYSATVYDSIPPAGKLENYATVTWASASSSFPHRRDGSGGINDYDGNSTVEVSIIDLNISKEDSPHEVYVGGLLNYTIRYNNTGDDVTGVWVGETYDENVTFISSDPVPDDGTNNKWTLGSLSWRESGTINVTVSVNSGVVSGTLINNTVNITCNYGTIWEHEINTTVLGGLLSIDKQVNTTDKKIHGDSPFNYTIYIDNINQTETSATNIIVKDIVDDEHLEIIGCDPPYEEIVDSSYYWHITELKPDDGIFKINITARLLDSPDDNKIYNYYNLSCDQMNTDHKVLETEVSSTLNILKTADKEAYEPGELVNYTINYSNSYSDRCAKNTVIHDVLPDVEYIGASPSPDEIDGNVLIWHNSLINHGDLTPPSGGFSEGSIKLVVKIKERPEVNYDELESVSGEGYVFSRKWLSTARKPYNLVNYVNISAYIVENCNDDPVDTPEVNESAASITVLGVPGTEIKDYEHGSGSYQSDEQIKYRTKNRSIELESDMQAEFHETSLNLPRNRSINYTSRWTAETSGRNMETGASLHESYRYAKSIDRDTYMFLDMNGSEMRVDSTFEGMGHLGVLKKSEANATASATPVFESREDYTGSFRIYGNIEEYGSNVQFNKNASGSGFVARDTRIKDSQRTYEYGTGAYESDEIIRTHTSYIAKDIGADAKPSSFELMDSGAWANQSLKWKEGSWSRTANTSFLGEEITGADYIYADTTLMGLNELHTEANFSGTAKYRAILRDQVDVDEIYSGNYTIAKKMLFTGVPRYDEPHMTVSKEAIVDAPNTSIVKYIITVTNDGNKPLAPVYVTDIFPQGTEYVSASVKPSKQASTFAKWTLTHLSIGDESTIELNLNVTEEPSNLVNVVEASGEYDDISVSSSNFSAIEYDWLSCCPVEIRATKTAALDSSDPTIVWYTIRVANLEDYSMVAHITDKLPDGLVFLNSTPAPASYGPDQVDWTLTDLGPKTTETITFRAEATRNGTFMNRVHIDAYAIDGSDTASADAMATIVIGPAGETTTKPVFGWEVPDWDLNYTDDLADLTCEEWCLRFDEEA